ncbi:hypothetical protein [Vulcanisaeta distributa]|uniref:hypothetical protein n=1 Tax=Vulcanisaeta distributa TaxID=164451 RepID=UPI0011E51DF2|nr:hypothetical protein [Vulcanisaeta distributa]
MPISQIVNGVSQSGFNAEIWAPGRYTIVGNKTFIFVALNLIGNYYLTHYGTACAWLIIAIINGTAYLGYSLDDINVNWYYSYPVGNAFIQPGPVTQLIISGENGHLTSIDVVLTLYYWNGTTWLPAPSIGVGNWTEGYVIQAWVYWNNNVAVISCPSLLKRHPAFYLQASNLKD